MCPAADYRTTPARFATRLLQAALRLVFTFCLLGAFVTESRAATGSVQSSVKIAHNLNGGPTLANTDYFGFSAGSIGDLNRDGIADLAAGAFGDDTGGTDRGALYVLFMEDKGAVSSSVKIASGTNGGPVLVNGDRFGASVASVGDLDRDGIPDLVVGAPYNDTGGADRGALYVLFMQADGTVRSSVKIASGTSGGPSLADGVQFGVSAACIGDLNGDGIPDVAVGANRDDTGGTDRGALYVLFMQPDGIVGSSVKIASGLNGGPTLSNSDLFGASVAAIGDLNRDGIPDMITGAPVQDSGGTDRGALYVLFMQADGTVSSSVKIASGLNGGPTLVNSDQFGASASSMGDLDQNGIPDLAVGTNRDDTGGIDRGAVYLLFMQADGTAGSSLKIASSLNGGPTLVNSDLFGSSVASLGDLDADGVADLAVGAHQNDTGGADRGGIQVLFLGADGVVPPDGTIASSLKIGNALNGGPTLVADDYFGSSAVAVGDLDRDGITDLAVGAMNDDTGGTDRGALYVLFMQADGMVSSRVKIASGTSGGPALANGDNFGRSVGPAGDLDRDGIPDLVVGAHKDDTDLANTGAVYVLFMQTDGTVRNTVKIASNTHGGPPLGMGYSFGTSVGPAGDLDRDGIPDLAVGAPVDGTGGAGRGALYLLFMQADGTARANIKIASGTNGGPVLANSSYFGSSVAPAGDLDRDGTPDLAIGSYMDDTGNTDAGALYVLFMQPDGTARSTVKICSGLNGGPTLAGSDGFGFWPQRLET